MNYKTEEILIICLAFVILIATALILNPSMFGYLIYEPEFTYNESLIDTTNGYSLLPYTETTTLENTTQSNSYITSAIYDGHDRTSKLQIQDNDILNVNKNKILNVVFDHELKNNDIIKIYIKQGDNSDVYLCPASTECSSPGYGLVTFTGQIGYYTITISNLESPTNSFNIDPTNVKFDYVYAIHPETTYTNITTTKYPESAILISEFIEPANLSSFGLLEKQEELNGQSILYEYTTDDVNWNIIENFNLSNVNSTKIKFKVTLQSDTTNTPILYNLILNYYVTESLPCTEEWRCSPWDVCINGTQKRECTDLNLCGTTIGMPNLIQNCVPECTENWICGNWTECVNSTQTRICTDLNDCSTNLNRPIETQECIVENNQTSQENQTIPETPSSGSSGGGGGGSAPSTVYQTSATELSTPKVEAKKEEKSIPLYEFSQPKQENAKIITGSAVAEKKPARFYISIFLFALFITVCYLFYRKLIGFKE